MINNKIIEDAMQQICQQVDLSYDKILYQVDQLLIPSQIQKLITNSPTLYSIPQEQPFVLNFANEVLAEITPLFGQILILNKEKSEQFQHAHQKNSDLQNTNSQEFQEIKRNGQNSHDMQLQEPQDLLKQQEQEIQQSNHSQNQIIKDKQEILKNLVKQDQTLDIAKQNQNITEKQENITQNQQLQKSILLDTFTFSQTYKSPKCQVSQHGTLFYNESLFFSCLCDQAISNQGIVRFAYLIHKIINNQTMIGIGAKEIIISKSSSYINLLYGGAYLLRSSGEYYSHHQKEKNGNQIAFTFTNNDIVIIEVEIQKQYIKWIKHSTKQSFLLEIDPQYEYHPCICGPGQIEILNTIIP